MGNDPTVEIVAKQRSELTDRIAKAVIKNFGGYNAAQYTKLVGKQDPHWDGYRHLRLTPFEKGMKEKLVYGKRTIPNEFLDVDFTKHSRVSGNLRYGSIRVDVASQEESISQQFPYCVVSFLLDPIVNDINGIDDINGIARVACGPPLELIRLDDLRLTPQEQEQFRVVPYWQGGAKASINHFKYDEFRNLGITGLTEAFLLSNKTP